MAAEVRGTPALALPHDSEQETHDIHVRRRGLVVKGPALWTFWLLPDGISIGAGSA